MVGCIYERVFPRSNQKVRRTHPTVGKVKRVLTESVKDHRTVLIIIRGQVKVFRGINPLFSGSKES